MPVTKTFNFWGRGRCVPERVQLRAVRCLQKQENRPVRPEDITFTEISSTCFPLRHRVGIERVRPANREEGVTRTVALISAGAEVHLIKGDLKGFGKLNLIYGRTITDWIKAEVLRIIDGESRRIGFMYTIYGDEIGITSQPGTSKEQIEEFLGSIPEILRQEFSRYGVARGLLSADKRVKAQGGYPGVELAVFEIGANDMAGAELYDADFNRGNLWVPKIRFKFAKSQGHLSYEEIMCALDAELRPSEGNVGAKDKGILSDEAKAEIRSAAQVIRNLGRYAEDELDYQYPILSKKAVQQIVRNRLARGEILRLGKIKVLFYEHQGRGYKSFKELNDGLGTSASDEMLKLLAHALDAQFPTLANLARMPVPPDEFVFALSENLLSLGDLEKILKTVQFIISKYSNFKVAFEVSHLNSEEAPSDPFLVLDNISRAAASVEVERLEGGNTIKIYRRDMAEALDREIQKIHRAEALRAEAALLKSS